MANSHLTDNQSSVSIPAHPISRDIELEQRTLEALDLAYERAILAELERESRPEVSE